jgi:hypothetical protein
VLFATLALAGAARGDSEQERKTLVGLRGVHILVEKLTEEAERDGLLRASVQMDVELKLRQSGIRMLTEREAAGTPGVPHLYVQVNTVKTPAGTYAYSVTVALKQDVLLERARGIRVVATTWAARGLGLVGAARLEAVRERVRDLVDEFVNAHRTANPRTR